MAKSVGARVDALKRLRDKRLTLQHQVDEMKRTEAEESEALGKELEKLHADKITGKTASFSRTVQTVARVEDWDSFYRYISRTKSWDLLQRRINQSAYRDRLEDRKRVAGTVPEHVIKYNLTKVG